VSGAICRVGRADVAEATVRPRCGHRHRAGRTPSL